MRETSITSARLGVSRLHRHLPTPPPGALVAFELVRDGWPVGFALVGRPVSRILQARGWVEVTRNAVVSPRDGGPLGGASALYGAAARWARRRGVPILTYTRIDEPGTSLRGAGWVPVGVTQPRVRGWDRPSRPRPQVEQVAKVRWVPAALAERWENEATQAE